jgi:trans-2-enoyl-CoA reductase
MILFEKSIVLAATFLLIVLFIGYLGIKFKKPNSNSIKENLTGQIETLTSKTACSQCASSLNNVMYQKLEQEQNNFEKQVQKQLQQMQKQITNNTKGVNDYLKNKKELQKAMKSSS